VPALAGCDAAVFLVHAMGTGHDDYPERERESARSFAEAAGKAGVQRIVYLGGVMPAKGASRHLRSRERTGAILRTGPVETAALALREQLDPWRSTAAAALVGIVLSVWTLGPRLRAVHRDLAWPACRGRARRRPRHHDPRWLRAGPGRRPRVRGHDRRPLPQHRRRREPARARRAHHADRDRRGAGLARRRGRPGDPRAKLATAAISVALYVLPQLPGHVPVLIAAATGLGAVFTAQRLRTGRLTDSIVTHAIWSVAVFVVFPVS
jgi:hypothetical protein